MRRLLPGLLLLLALPALAEERILDFHSEISVQPDSSLIVEERIRVRAEGRQIRRGIYRDFPTRYRSRQGFTRSVGFELLETTRDGQPEAAHSESRRNGLRIYLGRADVFLPPGEHEYRIRYRTTRQLGFFEDHDELYWNVTGNGWDFPIRHASARVTLPGAVAPTELRLAGYTGPQGATASDLTTFVEDERHVLFETTRPLAPREGFTLVLGWPKGLVTPPSAAEAFYADNRHNLVAVGSVFAVLIYYLLAWQRVGRDPEKGVIAPLYRPPEDLSPASMRFVMQMGYDEPAFAAALVNLAVKGVLSIEQSGTARGFVIRQLQETPADLAPGEQALLDALFADGKQIELDPKNRSRLRQAREQHQQRLAEDYDQVMFRRNRKYLTPGILLSIAGIGLTLILMPQSGRASTLAIAVLLASILVFGSDLWRKWRQGKPLTRLLPMFAMMVAFLYVFREVITQMIQQDGPPFWPVVGSLVALALLNLGFFEWIRAYTPGGRRLMDRIEGFRLYLSVAEGDDLMLRGEPEFTAQRYQDYLPYAIALGVESAWSQRLQQAIASGLIAADFQPDGLHFATGDYGGLGPATEQFSQQLNSAIASATAAPGSSSGFSGGSSGGGGGGGGGGGW